MKLLLSLAIPVALFALTACGPDSELVASGKIHVCGMQALEAQLEANPGDADLLSQLADKAGMLEAVIDTADEGDRADLSAAIQAAVAEGCD